MIELHFCFTYDEDEGKWAVELDPPVGRINVGRGKTMEEAISNWKEGLAVGIFETQPL